MKFAVLSMDGVTDLGQYFKSLIRMSMSGSYFLSIDSEVFVTSQVIILEILDDVLSRNLHIGGVETLKFFVNYLDSVGIRGLELIRIYIPPIERLVPRKIIELFLVNYY